MATKRLVGIYFQYQYRLHRFVFRVQSVIPSFLEMLNAILNIFLSCCVYVRARCLLVCACVDVYASVYVSLGNFLDARTQLALEPGSSLFSCMQKIGWHSGKLVLVWCELFQSQNCYVDSKSTWTHLYLSFFSLCFYFLPDNPNNAPLPLLPLQLAQQQITGPNC